MATGRIESGRVDIRGPGSVPMQRVGVSEVNFVGPRAEAQGAGQLAEALDRMSAGLFGESFRQREKEGLQFAAENPLTPEQIEAAKNGRLADLDLGGNPVSVFQEAVRKARSLELSSKFESEGRNELVRLLNQVELGQATSDQVQSKITTMVDGFGASLAKVDAEAAYKFRATMATHGNAVLKSALDFEVKRIQNQAEIKFESDFTVLNRLVEDAASTDPDKFPSHAEVYRSAIRREAQKLNNPRLYSEYVVKGEAAIRNAQIQAVTKTLLLDPKNTDMVALLDNIRTGQAGQHSAMLQGLIARDFDAVAKIEANIITAVNHRNAVANQQREADKRAAIKEFIPLYEKAVALPDGNPERKRLAGQISLIAQRQPDAVPLSVLKDLLEPDKEGNSGAEFNVLQGIYEGRITKPEQIWNAAGLNAKQKVSLLKTLTSEDRRDQRELDNGLARLAGIPTMPGQVTVIDPKGVEFQRLQGLRSQALQIQAEATAQGKILTPRMILQQVEGDLETRRNSEGAKAARKQLDDVWSKKDWINGPITRDNLPALKIKAGTDQNKLREYNRIEQLVKQAEGN